VTQNIYDRDDFFAGYSRLPRSVKGLRAAPEWPSLRAMLPDLSGLRVLYLGCGFGWFCRWARQNGAADVAGFDVSRNMLVRASSETNDDKIRYSRADLERLKLPRASFDLVYSSLAFHYLKNMERLMSQIYRSLVPGGSLVFSVEHPIYTAPSNPGWSRKTWPVDGYLNEGPRTTDWLAKGVIKQHRTVATYINLLLASGFSISKIDEWGPSKRQIKAEPSWALERERPSFLLIAAKR
jgi:SAM-dependent methyltransferase